jgi:PAS domain S-box-containing protein
VVTDEFLGDVVLASVSVLLVDDRPANLVALRAILDDLKLEYAEAHSGEEALERLEKEVYAAVLLDVQMPGLDGFETAKRMRSMDRSRHTPIIFLTAYDDDQFTAEQAYSLGAVDYLTKPLVPTILRAKVQGFVDLFREKQRAQHQAEQLQMLVNGTREYAIVLLGVNGEVVTWNAGAERLTGYTADEVIGQHFSTFYPSEAIRQQWPERDLEIARSEGRVDDEGYRIRKDGSIYWSNVVITALHDESGRLRGFSKITRDMSERKRAQENERRLLAEESRRQVAEAQSAAVQLERERLEEADRRKDQFLATLAHELRNPLAPIRNGLQILQLPNIDEDTAKQSCEVMSKQVDHMVRLVDDLLDVSRVTRGKIELRLEEVCLQDVVSRAVESVSPIVQQRHHQLTVSLPVDALSLETDVVRLTQVLGNLLTNAAKYTDPNGRIVLTGSMDNGVVILSVRDNGIGIAPELLPHVFELFVQGGHSATTSQGGLGIGLTLVKSMVELLGGTVEASSEGIGKGSEFCVRLPIASQRKKASEPQMATTIAPLQQRRLLVVDDNLDAANTLGLLLRMKGHQVEIAYDGPSALEMARMRPPDAVFLDIGMPGMDGFEVARRLRQSDNGAMTLAALTGWGQHEDRRRTAEAGFDHHLVKPVDMGEIDALLNGLSKVSSHPSLQ